MNKYIIATFVTKDTPYESVLENYFMKSMERWRGKLEFVVTYYPDQGDWYKNTALKPKYVLELFDRYKDRDVVLLDADCKIEQYPQLFDTLPKSVDIAYHTLNWRAWYGLNTDTEELLSGTMYLRNNDAVKQLCKDWHGQSKNGFDAGWEQKVLERLLQSTEYDIVSYDLPIEYCYMDTRPGGLQPLVKCEPVIRHYQASRHFKRKK